MEQRRVSGSDRKKVAELSVDGEQSLNRQSVLSLREREGKPQSPRV